MSTAAVDPESLHTAMRRGQLLVVDDQPANIQLLGHALALQNDVFAATSGEQALAFCRKTPPDLVLLDVMMPTMDGWEVCRQLKQDPETQNIPVIFITGHEGTAEENRCWAVGGADFVNKPINVVTLRHRVQFHLTMKRQTDLLRAMAFKDGLTQIANRRHFDERLLDEWRRCSRSGATLSLLLIDVDFFKRYNDHYGHPAGDESLKQVASALQASLSRPFDLIARYGGEEFACLLPETDLAGATATAVKMEQAVRQLGIAHQASDISQVLTISVGVASLRPDQDNSSASLIQQADVQLYQAKKQGRGQVCAG